MHPNPTVEFLRRYQPPLPRWQRYVGMFFISVMLGIWVGSIVALIAIIITRNTGGGL
jgi:hypothetical protein